MLDAETKRRIDTARDILVGKVPDPKSQVEQITIALIYKFMDDMDAESEELGGNRKFFAGEFAQYGWPKLVRSGLGGHEVLNLYSEAITRMPENPGIPPLFRDIFKNAFLPYRDPETLRAFLKIIDEFEYDHSERLGDAFEYLLSVLGSQGDAGQFRTPRHIIDFIVAIINPKKDETILDPACGTAGFLISSYKHILKSNTDEKDHSTLTPDEKGKLADNFKGYDISPDMVRLSLVNLYLHGFVAPQIHEYDTLTSEDRWNEYADVVLANPPFMSPKGGIRPHNRFSVKSKRSEVLFVDYMAEHLTPNGRAGIIVPEGIIFQSQNAYKQLRKMLVEEYLVAVISLPAGVFNPYSGVKTSILILDKALARRRGRIGFFKVENDGFDLGAQRRKIDENDLPQIGQVVTEYLNMDEQDKDSPESMLNKLTEYGSVQIVAKDRIAANGEYNLSGERYREISSNASTWPLTKMENLFEPIRNGYNVKQKDEKGRFKVTRIQTISDGIVNLDKTKWTDDDVTEGYFMKHGDILLSHINSMDHLAKTALFTTSDIPVIHGINLISLRPKLGVIEPLFALYVMKHEIFVNKARNLAQRAVNQASIKLSDIRKITIPLPPLEIQRQIVVEIESYQKVIDGARAVVDNYRPHITIDPDWPAARVGEVFRKAEETILPKSLRGPVTYVGLENITQETGHLSGNVTTDNPMSIKSLKNVFYPGDILYGKLRPNLNKVWFSDRKGICSTDIFVIRPLDESVLPSFYAHIFRSKHFNSAVLTQIKGAQLPRVGWQSFANLEIPLPHLDVQKEIAMVLKDELALVTANQELIERFEKKIQAAITRVWGD